MRYWIFIENILLALVRKQRFESSETGKKTDGKFYIRNVL